MEKREVNNNVKQKVIITSQMLVTRFRRKKGVQQRTKHENTIPRTREAFSSDNFEATKYKNLFLLHS